MYFIKKMILAVSSLPRVYPFKSLYKKLRDCRYTWRKYFFFHNGSPRHFTSWFYFTSNGGRAKVRVGSDAVVTG